MSDIGARRTAAPSAARRDDTECVGARGPASPTMRARLHTCLSRLAPYLDRRRTALTGGIAIELHARAAGRIRRRERWPEPDVDVVAAHVGAVAPAVAGEFLVSHFHLPQPGYEKFLVQLVDPVSALRVDIFPDSLGALSRASAREVAGVSMLVLAPADILKHALVTLSRATRESPADRQHHLDALLLGEMCDRPVPAPEAASLVRDAYSRDVHARCARCERSGSDDLPLASKLRIRDLLGYV